MFARDESKGFRQFGGGYHGGFGPGFRAGRGMMEPAILGALTTKPMHGYEIISYLEEQSHGVWRPSAGSVYPTLQLLEEKGFVKSEEKDGKKTYQLTDEGKEHAQHVTEMREHMSEHFSGQFKEMKQSRQQLGEMMHVMRDIYRRGTTEQKAKLMEAINNFQAELEQIHAGESS